VKLRGRSFLEPLARDMKAVDITEFFPDKAVVDGKVERLYYELTFCAN
jgi:hypothetical protein